MPTWPAPYKNLTCISLYLDDESEGDVLVLLLPCVADSLLELEFSVGSISDLLGLPLPNLPDSDHCTML